MLVLYPLVGCLGPPALDTTSVEPESRSINASVSGGGPFLAPQRFLLANTDSFRDVCGLFAVAFATAGHGVLFWGDGAGPVYGKDYVA